MGNLRVGTIPQSGPEPEGGDMVATRVHIHIWAPRKLTLKWTCYGDLSCSQYPTHPSEEISIQHMTACIVEPFFFILGHLCQLRHCPCPRASSSIPITVLVSLCLDQLNSMDLSASRTIPPIGKSPLHLSVSLLLWLLLTVSFIRLRSTQEISKAHLWKCLLGHFRGNQVTRTVT